MCGGNKGTTTSQTSQTAAPNPQAAGLYSSILGQAQGVAATPYQPFTGQQVAPINAQQTTGINAINAEQPVFGQATDMMQQASQPITAAQISQYESPYTQQVVNATQAEFNNQNAQQQQGVLGNAVAQGALGGNRTGIAQAELANQQSLAQAPVIANLENQGYTTGLNTALTEQQAQQQGALGLDSTANAALSGANAQIGAGTLQQQTQQAQDTAQYQNYLNAMGYPFQTTQWLAGIGTGVGSQMGGTTAGTGATTVPPPSIASEATGAGTAALGLAALGLSTGGSVNRAKGGGVADGPDYPVTPEAPHTLHAQQKQLVNGDRHVQMFPHGTKELPLPHGMKRVQSHSGTFHYNPQHVTASDIHSHSKSGHEHALLGLGPFSKHEIAHRLARGEHALAIVERNEHGHEVRAALGTHNTAHVQAHHMNRGKSKGHTVHIEFPHKVLSDRMAVHRQTGGSVGVGGISGLPTTPYTGGMSYIPGTSITPGHGAPATSGQAPQIPGQPQANPLGNALAQKGLTNTLANLNKNDSGSMTGGVPLAGLNAPTDTGDSYDNVADTSGDDDADPFDAPGLDYDDVGVGDDVFKRGGGVRGYDGGGGVANDPGVYSQLATDDSNLPSPPPTAAGAGVAATPPIAAISADPNIGVSSPSVDPNTGVAPTVSVPMNRPVQPASDSVNSGAGAGANTALMPTAPDDVLDKAAAATKHLESSGDYSNITTTTGKHGNPQSALGAYGIMDFNLPQWSKEALGREVSKDEFLNNPDIQDQIYRHKMGQYITNYGVEGAGRAWLGGEGSLNAPLAKDAFGTTVGSYGSKFANLVGTTGQDIPPSAEPTSGRGLRNSFQGVQGVATTPGDTGNQQSGFHFFNNPELGAALLSAGAGMMSSRSPYFGVGAGEGLAAGTQTYYGMKEREQEQALNQQKVGIEASKLQNESDWHKRQYEQTQQRINQESNQVMPYQTKDGHPVIFEKKSGTMKDGQTGQPITDADSIQNIQQTKWTNSPTLVTKDGDPVRTNPRGDMQNARTGEYVGPGTQTAVMSAKVGAPLSDTDRQARGQQLALGDLKGAYNGLGFSQSLQKSQIYNEAIKQLTTVGGMTPQAAGEYLSQQNQSWAAQGVGLNAEARTAGSREANLNMILRTFDSAVPAALEQAKGVWRTNFVPLNQIYQKIQMNLANTAEATFGTANLQLAENWAKAMNPTGVMREDDRDKALGYLNTATSYNAYEAVVHQLQTQIGREKSAIQDFRKSKGDTPVGTANALTYDANKTAMGNATPLSPTKPGVPAATPATAATPPAATPATPATNTPPPVSTPVPKEGDRKQFKQGWGVYHNGSWGPDLGT